MDFGLFSGAPRFLTRPKAFTISVGKDATLSCQIIGNPTPTVVWEKDKLLIQPSSRFKTVEDGELYRLTIYDLTLADSGQYICRAKNIIGEAFAAVTLRVSAEQDFIVLECSPYFILKPTSLRISLGDDASFQCRVQGNPPPEVTWEKDGWKLGTSSDSNRIQIESLGESSILKLHCVRAGDSGTYTCRAESPSGEASAAAALIVDSLGSTAKTTNPHYSAYNLVSPSAVETGYGRTSSLLSHLQKRREEMTKSSRDATHAIFTRTCMVTEGKHARLSCYVTGHPKPETVWRKDGVVVEEGRRHMVYEDELENFVLKILYCKQEDNGLYTCTASNLAGQTYSSVLVIVKGPLAWAEPRIPFKTKLRDVEVQEKETAMLQCEVVAPSTDTSWFKEETRLDQGAKYKIEEEGTLRRLTIRNVTTDDDAVYICEMMEGSRTVAELSVKGNIVKKLPRKTAVPEMDAAIFCVELDRGCEKVVWMKNGEVVKANSRVTISAIGNQHTLTIRECQAADAGEIAFLAEDCRTSTQFTVSAPRRLPPHPPVNPVVKEKAETWVTLAWSAPQMDRPVPVAGYLVERRRLGSVTWFRCHDSESVPGPEFTISGLSEKGDYQFRITAVNSFGQSSCLEFPGTIHLEPLTSVKTPLKDVEVSAEGEATFSVELAAVCSGLWILNGRVLQSNESFVIMRTKNIHTLIIRDVRGLQDGAEVRFRANNIESCANLRIKALRAVPFPTLSQPPTSLFRSDLTRYHDTSLMFSQWGEHLLALFPRSGGRGLYPMSQYDPFCGHGNQGYGSLEVGVVGSTQCLRSGGRGLYPMSQYDPFCGHGNQGYGSPSPFAEFPSPPYLLVGMTLGERMHISLAFERGHPFFFIPLVLFDFFILLLGAASRVIDRASETEMASAGGTVQFVSEVSNSAVTVKWRKDGSELTPSKKYEMQAMGRKRVLKIHDIMAEDAGVYECVCDSDTMPFQLSVKGEQSWVSQAWLQQVTIREDSSDCSVSPLEVILLKEAQSTFWRSGRSFSPSTAPGITSSRCNNLFVFVALLLGLPDRLSYFLDKNRKKKILKLELVIFTAASGFLEKDQAGGVVRAVSGERTELVTEMVDVHSRVVWYKEGKEIRQSKKFTLEERGKQRKLIISGVRKEDEGTYSCQSGDDTISFTLRVPGTEQPPNPALHAPTLPVRGGRGEAAMSSTFYASCPCLWQEVCVCGGLPLRSGSGVVVVGGGAVRGNLILAQYSRLSVLQHHARAAFRCSYCCDSKKSGYSHSITLHNLSRWGIIQSSPLLFKTAPPQKTKKQKNQFITLIKQYNLFLFKCIFNPDESAKFVNKPKSPQEVMALHSGTLELSCEVAAASTAVVWRKDQTEIRQDRRMTVVSQGTQRRLVIKDASRSDQGSYTCETAEDKVAFQVAIEISDPELKTMKQRSVCGDITTVLVPCPTLSAFPVTTDPQLTTPPQKKKITETHSPIWSILISFQILILLFTALCCTLSRSYSGGWDCICFMLFFGPLFPEPEPAFSNQDSVQREVKPCPSESATLTCEVSDSKMEVKWYKDGKLLTSSKKIRMESEGKTRRIVLQTVEKRDAGEYVCEAAGQKLTFRVTIAVKKIYLSRTRTRTPTPTHPMGFSCIQCCVVGLLCVCVCDHVDGMMLEPPTLTPHQKQKKQTNKPTCFSLEPAAKFQKKAVQKEPIAVQEKEDIILVTTVAPQTAVVRWLRDGMELKQGKKYEVRSEGSSRTLVVKSSESKDSGVYICETNGDKQEFRVKVKEAPIKFSKKLTLVSAAAGETVTLTCELNQPKGDVLWKRNGKEIKASGRLQIRADGAKRILTITGMSVADEGEYSCECRDDKTSTKVTTKVPRVVKFTGNLANLVIEEGKEAIFKCSISHEDAAVTWYKNGVRLKASKRVTMGKVGTSHTLTIGNVTLQDSSEFSAEAEGAKTKATLQVQAIPILFKKKLENRTVEEGETVVLEVELTKLSAEVKWMKNSVVLPSSENLEVKAQGAKHILTIRNLSYADRGHYSCETLDDKTQAKLDVEMRKIRLVKGLEEMQVQEKETITFEVELSHQDMEGTWLKDGVKLKAGGNCRITTLGKKHAMTLSSLKLEDAGLIAFQTEGLHTSGRLIVTELPVKFSTPLTDLRATEKDKVKFECELSRSNTDVKWFKDTVELRPGKRHGIIAQGRKRSLLIHKCSYEDQGTYLCDAVDDKTSATLTVQGRTFVLLFKAVQPEDAAEIKFVAENATSTAKLQVKELPVKIVKPLRDKIAIEKHRGIFECQVSRPNALVKWHRQKSELVPGKKYEMTSQGLYRKLIINEVEFGDEDTYTCDAGDDKTTAQLYVEEQAISIVKGLCDVKVTEPAEASFRCELSIPSVKPPKWTLKGELLQASAEVEIEQDETVHYLTFRKTNMEMTGQVQFTMGKSKSTANLTVEEPLVKVLKQLQNITAKEKTSTTLSCELSPSRKVVRWYKDQVPIDSSEKYRLKQEKGVMELTIHNLKPEDSGAYSCRSGSAETCATLTVEAHKVEIRKPLEDMKTEEDSNATFSCELSHDDEEVEWYLNDTLLYSNDFNEIRKEGSRHTLTLKHLTSDDSGTITVKAGGQSQTAKLHVKEKPAVFMRSLDDMVGEEQGTVTLECEASKSKVQPVWKKDDVVLSPSDKYELTHTGKRLCLLIHDLNRRDAGLYMCDVGTDVAKANVTVQELNIGITKRLKTSEVKEGEGCSFECILSHESIDECSWTINGQEVENSDRFDIFNKGRKYILKIKEVKAADAGEVVFTARNLNSKASLIVKGKAAVITKQLESSTVTQGEDVVLSCEISPPDASVRWYKDGKTIRKSNKYEMCQEGALSKLTIHDAASRDSGEYSCETEASKSKATVTVKEKVNRFTKELRDIKAGEKGTAIFECETENPVPKATWRKGMAELRDSKKYEVGQKGTCLTLAIKQLEKSDSDTYTCDIGDTQSRAKLTVQGQKVLITEDLEDMEVLEGDSATFTCRISPASYSNIKWFLDKTPLHTNELNEIQSQEGGYHMLTVKQLSLKDSGTIRLEAGDKTTSASLVVRERPAVIVKKLSDVTVTEGEEIVLCCETSKPDSPVRWYKDGKAIKSLAKYKTSRAGAEAKLLIRNAERKDNGRYECEMGECRTGAVVTVNAAAVIFNKELQGKEAKEGGRATLRCEISKPDAPVEWRKGDSMLQAGDKYEIKQKGKSLELTIQNLQPEDSGEYACVAGSQKTSATLNVNALPVSFKQELQDEEAKEGGRATLHCEVSKPEAAVEWRKGDEVLQPNDKYEIKQKGKSLELTVRNLQPEDSGEYTCIAGDQKTSAILKVNALPVLFKQELKNEEAKEGGRSTLRCEVSKTDAQVQWKKGDAVIQPSDKYEIRQKGKSLELIVRNLQLEDSGEYTCVTGDQKTSASFNLSALPVSFKRELKNEEAKEGGRVSLRCEVSKPDAPVQWKKGDLELRPGDKYEMKQIGKSLELIVRNLQPEDSGEYTCATGDQKTSASLKVNALPVSFKQELQDEEAKEGGRATLRCEVSKPEAPVEWRKGDEVLQHSEKYEIKQQEKSLEMTVHNLQPEDSGEYTCITGDQKTTARLKVEALPVSFKRELQDEEAKEGGRATLRCEVSKPEAAVEWKKGDEVLQHSEKYEIKQQEKNLELTVNNLQPEDAGEYTCITGDQKTTARLKVEALPVSFKQELQDEEAKEGGRATLRCEVSKPEAAVEWRKGDEVLQHSEKYEIKQQEKSLELTVHNLQPEDAGEYTCITGDQKTTARLKVEAFPVLFKQELKNEEAKEGGTAALRCEVSEANAPVEWRKGDEVLQPSEKYKIKQLGTNLELIIHDLQTADSGDYTCITGDQKTTASLKIEALPVLFKCKLCNQEAEEGTTAALRCEVTKPGASVVWLRGGAALQPSPKYEMRQEGAVVELLIHDLEVGDGGNYTCNCGDQQTTADLMINALPALFKQDLRNMEAEEGGTAVLRCELSKPGAPVEWRKGTSSLHPGEKYEMKQEGATIELLIRHLTPEDSGEYTCDSGDHQTSAALKIRCSLPVQFKKELQDTEVEEGETAVLRCEVTKPDAPVEWRKGGVVLFPCAKYKMKQEGAMAELSIQNLETEDAGNYTCDTGDQQTTAALKVKEADVRILKGLQNVAVGEADDVVFRCEVSHERARDVQWTLQDIPLQSNEMNEISVEKGRTHILRLRKVTQEDSGLVTFKVGPYTSTAELTVKEPAVHITEGLRDVCIQENKDAVFECKVSREHARDVEWSLGGVQLQNNQMNEISVRSGGVHCLRLRGVTLEDSGTITFRVGQQTSSAELKI
uniref:Obscurin, cytoskeletal calmodulin and titin-interacting RhoGEF n=1 Tax=Latimeria chalumnae TaxID=7897 RepID=H3A8L3_LATCH